jgi:hypothetical protein
MRENFQLESFWITYNLTPMMLALSIKQCAELQDAQLKRVRFGSSPEVRRSENVCVSYVSSHLVKRVIPCELVAKSHDISKLISSHTNSSVSLVVPDSRKVTRSRVDFFRNSIGIRGEQDFPRVLSSARATCLQDAGTLGTSRLSDRKRTESVQSSASGSAPTIGGCSPRRMR